MPDVQFLTFAAADGSSPPPELRLRSINAPEKLLFFFGGGQLTWTSPGVRLSIERSAASGPVKNTTTDGKLSLKKKKESDRVALQPEHERQPQGFNDPNRRN